MQWSCSKHRTPKHPASIPYNDITGVRRHSSHSPTTNNNVPVSISLWSDHFPSPAQSTVNFFPASLGGTAQLCGDFALFLEILPLWSHMSLKKLHFMEGEKLKGTKKHGDRSGTWGNGITSSRKYCLFHNKWGIITTSNSGGLFLCCFCSCQSPQCQIKLILKAFLTVLHLPDNKSHLWDPFSKYTLF